MSNYRKLFAAIAHKTKIPKTSRASKKIPTGHFRKDPQQKMTLTTVLTSTFQTNDIVIYTRTNGKTSRALITDINIVGGRPSYMIHLLENGLEKNVTGSSLTLVISANDRDYDKDNLPRVYQPDIWERFYFYVRGTVRSLSWYTIFFGFLAILWMWPDKKREQQWLMDDY